MDRSQELRNCNAVKTILMGLVVLNHSIAFNTGSWGPYIPTEISALLGILAEWVGTFHNYAFALVSGYIYQYLRHERGQYRNYRAFLVNKAKRLLIPYVFIAAVWAAPVHAYFYGSENLIQKYVLGISPSQLWFLLMLFWVFAIWGLISDWVDRHPKLGVILVLGIYCIGYVVPSVFCINVGFRYVLFFYIGTCIRKYDLINRILYRIPTAIFIAVDLILFAIASKMPAESLIFKGIRLGMLEMLHIIGAVGAFVVSQRLVNCCACDNRAFLFLSEHSMAIYLVHQQLIYFSLMFFYNMISPVGLSLVNFGVALFGSSIFAVLMSQTRVTRFLIGSK